ncbi:MAG TPA: hypothetical protein VM260_01090, partial [Pirellula sp.]|nr:hypothetical protein [Pirellula sp.]
GEIREEVNGILPSIPPRNFRIEVTPFQLAGNIVSDRNSNAASETSTSETSTALYRVKVEILETTTNLPSVDSKPLCQLTRLVRNPRMEEPSADGYGSETPRPPANSNRSNRKAGRTP